MNDPLQSSIALLTELVRVHRMLARGKNDMAIEIKGLGSTVQRARDAINSARRASTDLETAAGAFAVDADEITGQIKKHHTDLLFEAQTLGNSPPLPVPLKPPAEPAGDAKPPVALPVAPTIPDSPRATPSLPEAFNVEDEGGYKFTHSPNAGNWK
jgi:hypothetical protein